VHLTVPATSTATPATTTARPDRAASGTAAAASAPGQRGMVTPGDATSTSVTDQARPRPADEPSSPTAPVVMDDLPTTAADSRANGQDDDDLVEVQGARPSEPLLVRRGWLRDHLPKGAPGLPARKQPRPQFVPCDPLTGARLDPGNHLTTASYRPGATLAALVRARDGRCRFPGCSVAARFCDLDHVRPWPTGPTTAPNLLTLCRRHHRIKQAPGWRVCLAPDGTTTWTDPTGRERTTAPLDALKALVLTADAPPDPPAPPTVTEIPTATEVPAAATTWSALETHLELRLEHHPHRERQLWLPPTHRRCTSAADLRAALARRRSKVSIPDAPPF
jgi:hypothetical protein